MQRSNQVPDRQLSKDVERRLARAGLGSQSKVTVSVRSGTATLSGSLQYEIQRRTVLHAARGVTGVRQIVDQLQVKPAPKKMR